MEANAEHYQSQIAELQRKIEELEIENLCMRDRERMLRNSHLIKERQEREMWMATLIAYACDKEFHDLKYLEEMR